jgi:hypothetical protein
MGTAMGRALGTTDGGVGGGCRGEPGCIAPAARRAFGDHQDGLPADPKRDGTTNEMSPQNLDNQTIYQTMKNMS